MSNSLNTEIKGKHVVVQSTFFKPEFRDIKYRVVLARDGFGCSSFTAGTAVFVTSPINGEKFRVEGYHIERFATDEEIAMVTG